MNLNLLVTITMVRVINNIIIDRFNRFLVKVMIIKWYSIGI